VRIGDAVEKLVRGPGPDEGFRGLVMHGDIFTEGGFQISSLTLRKIPRRMRFCGCRSCRQSGESPNPAGTWASIASRNWRNSCEGWRRCSWPLPRNKSLRTASRPRARLSFSNVDLAGGARGGVELLSHVNYNSSPALVGQEESLTKLASAGYILWRMAKKNAAAVQLGKRRMALLSKEERSQLGREAAKARRKKLTPEERSEIARRAGKAGGRGRRKD